MNRRLLHDGAWRMAQALMGTLERDGGAEGCRATLANLYEACRAGLEWYDTQARRLEKRLYPRD